MKISLLFGPLVFILGDNSFFFLHNFLMCSSHSKKHFCNFPHYITTVSSKNDVQVEVEENYSGNNSSNASWREQKCSRFNVGDAILFFYQQKSKKNLYFFQKKTHLTPSYFRHCNRK